MSKFKKIHIIINPAAGQEEPILSYINTAFQDNEIEWEISVTKQAADAAIIAKEMVGKADVIAVYGGDGSIAEVARVVKGTDTPLAILPGGTANVISKELGIPQDTIKALALLTSENPEVTRIDMGMMNNIPFIIRVNLGIMANMIIDADREMKNKLGQMAYGLSAVKTMIKTDPTKYRMKIDGQEVREEGVALTITNCGNIGIGNYSFLPEISVSDGFLDVLLLHQADLLSVLRVAGTTLLQKESAVLKHWRCSEVEIRLDSAQKIILDDFEQEETFLHIKVEPEVLKVVIPEKM